MTNEEILKKVIEKAVGNGYNIGGENFEIQKMDDDFIVWVFNIKSMRWRHDKNTIIFSHNFAEAFWGKEEVGWINEKGEACRGKPAYIIHLQRMVVEKEPLKYIEKFLGA